MTENSASPPASAGREEEIRARVAAARLGTGKVYVECRGDGCDADHVDAVHGFVVHAEPDITWLLDALAASRSESSRLREAVEKLNRYECTTDSSSDVNFGSMAPAADGEYVKWEDVRAALSPQPKEGA